MFEEVESTDGKKVDRYVMALVENAADNFWPKMWTMNIFDRSSAEIIYSLLITAAQANLLYRKNPHIHLYYPRTQADWPDAYRRVQDFEKESIRAHLNRVHDGFQKEERPFLVQ